MSHPSLSLKNWCLRQTKEDDDRQLESPCGTQKNLLKASVSEKFNGEYTKLVNVRSMTSQASTKYHSVNDRCWSEAMQ